ncbi:hypothetical protein [Microbacterium sp. gxy059]|uniref:hypothetical protein n=1 Tax=Microbacterium sp. gxy059 TaxID=2957199 RepID=UPI003D95AFDD
MLLALLAGAAVGAVRLVGGLLGADQAPWVLAGAMIAVLAIGGFSLRRELRRLVGGLRRIALPARATQSAAVALARVLHDRGEAPRYGRENVVVAPIERAGRAPLRHLVRLTGGAPDEQRRVLDAFAELVGPIGSPRFLLEVGAGDVRDEGWAGSLALRVAARLGGGSRFFAVPRDIGRRRADAQAFADEWRREIGSCLLHEIDAPEKLALLTRARRQAASDDEERATRREVWA